MTVYILSLGLAVIFGAIGFFLGMVRASVFLLGAGLGGLLALPLSSSVSSLVPKLGLTHPLWAYIMPPVIIYVLTLLLFLILSFVAYIPIARFYKFRADEVQRIRWTRVSRGVGAYIGVMTGLLCYFWLSIGVYVMGYASVPFSKPDVDPTWLKFLNTARNDQISSGWDKVVASWDPAPKKYYEVVDMLVFLMANNPGVKNRLKAYPPFLSLGERQEFKDMLGDKDYMNLIKVETSLYDIIIHEKSVGFLTNTDLWQELDSKIDLHDFRAFLMTGKSAKYDSIQMLGRWQLEPESIAFKVRRRKPDVTPAEWAAFRGSLATVAANTKMKATTDNKLEITITGSLPDPNQISLPKATNTAPRTMVMMNPNNPNMGPRVTGNLGGSGTSGMSAELRARYGLNRPGNPAGPGNPNMQNQGGQAYDPNNPEGTPPPPPKIETKTFQGSWEGEGDFYKITLTNDKGKTETVDASITDDLLSFDAFGYNFVFERYYN